MNQKTTDELMKILSGITNKTDLGNYTDTLSKDDVPDFAGYINNIINDNRLQAADVIRESLIQRNYGYQILNGTRKPSRDKVIAICTAIKLDSARTDRALAAAGYGRLYSKSRRDSIIIFALNKQLTVMELNELLCDMGENILD